jgi:hypothetical protein
MIILCTESFKQEYDTLMKKNSYKGLEQELIGYFLIKHLTNFGLPLRLTAH